MENSIMRGNLLEAVFPLKYAYEPSRVSPGAAVGSRNLGNTMWFVLSGRNGIPFPFPA